ncbi:MAG TPA: hemolysin family protein [Pirellulaceae bacterium]|nr:hemolysin family protein [Pirellulaceae bacterium]
MQEAWELWASLACTLVAAFTAIGKRSLRDYSHYDLEQFLRRRNRSAFLDSVIDWASDYAIAAETIHTLALLAASTFATLYAVRIEFLGNYGLPALLSVAAVAGLIVLALSSWIPWAVATWFAPAFLYATWRFWTALYWISFPLTLGVKALDFLSRRLAGAEADDAESAEEALEDEILAHVSAGKREGLLQQSEWEMIRGVLELDDREVGRIMTRRSEIQALEVESSWDEVLNLIDQVQRTRMPVYAERLDNIVGLLYAKDLLPVLPLPPEKRPPLRSLLRESWDVPETMPLDAILADFRRRRIHLAMVRNEYAEVVGLVTIEDVLEEIVGEIIDESDPEETRFEFDRIDENRAIAAADLFVDDVNERMDLALPESDDYESLGGLLISRCRDIPKSAYSVELGNVRLTVEDASPRKINRVRIEILEEST